MTQFHLHLVSDATGETLNAITKAVLVQFDEAEATEHLWALMRNENQIEKVLNAVERSPGIVLFTLVDPALRKVLEDGCRQINVPCIPVLDPVMVALSSYLGAESRGRPGMQHVMDAEYFSRIEAMNFTMSHDDGQLTEQLEQADVVLVGVSRTSKTPTCIYLANRGIKAANIPFVPQAELPPVLFDLDDTLIVGLTASPDRLIQIRRNRLLSLNQVAETDYVDLDAVRAEVVEARRLFAKMGWPTIDVSRRSIEETAAAIITLFQQRPEE